MEMIFELPENLLMSVLSASPLLLPNQRFKQPELSHDAALHTSVSAQASIRLSGRGVAHIEPANQQLLAFAQIGSLLHMLHVCCEERQYPAATTAIFF